jgi:two-component system response regulator
MRKGLVLVVDDNADHAELSALTLSHHRLVRRVVRAADGLEAYHYLFRTGPFVGRPENDNPDLVLLDLKLPRLDGFELMQLVRAAPAFIGLPIVVVSSSDELADVERALRCGANSFVRKPINYSVFANYLDLIATYWLMVNEAAVFPQPP